MPAAFLLATTDDELAAAWQQQLPAGMPCLRAGTLSPSTMPTQGLSLVIVADCVWLERLPAGLVDGVAVVVGQPRSAPFEQARMAGRARAYLSIEESRIRLRELAPLLAELAEKHAIVGLLTDRARRAETPRGGSRAAAGADAWEVWDFIEGALEALDSRDRLLAECRRAARTLLRASHTVFFLRDGDVLRADRGTSSCSIDEPIVNYLTAHPVLVDAEAWSGPQDPVAELSIRQRMAMWGTRLLVPLHDGTQLVGLVAFGVRDDGQPYDEQDRARSLGFARIVRQALARVQQVQRMQAIADRARLGNQYLPNTLLLGPDEALPRTVPLVVRSLVGDVRRTREPARVAATPEQPFRASAGLIAETGGVWAAWEEVSAELHDSLERAQRVRIELLKELALTLNHELGNALVSLSALRYASAENPPPAALIATAFADFGKLEQLNHRLALMPALAELQPARQDLREIVQVFKPRLNVGVRVGPDPVELNVAGRLIEFALESLLQSLAENRPGAGFTDLTLELRSTGEGSDLTALLSIKGRRLELEGILPEPTPEGVPNQGRIGVFLAKEIIRLHRGEIHAGPGLEGTEILVSLRSL